MHATTLAGQVSVDVTWVNTTELEVTLRCGDRLRQRTAAGGIYLALDAAPGVCSASVAEVAPVSEDVVTYDLELTYQVAAG